MRPDLVVKGIVFSEKSMGLVSSAQTYTLKVNLDATKEDIKKAVKSVFGVDVVSVNTSVMRGKLYKKMRSRSGGGPVTVKESNIKKAFVKIKKGQEISYGSLQAPVAEATQP